MNAKEKSLGKLRIIAADSYPAAATAAVKEIEPKERTVVLVPDQYTLQAEKLVLKTLNLKGSFNIFVNSFDRLFYFLCGEAKPMPAASAVMLLQKIISENAKKLKCFFRSADFPGFAEKIYGVITKLKSSGITPQALGANAANPSVPVYNALQRKLSDIRFLYEKYEEERQGFLDSNDRAQKLARFIAEGKIQKYNIVLTGFASLTKTETDVIKQFVLSGCPVTAAVIYKEDHRAYTNELYGGLLSLAAEAGVKPETVFIPSAPRPPVFRHLFDNLDRYPAAKTELKNNALTVTAAQGVYAEARKTAGMIAAYTRRGFRYRDIAVICPELESYIPAIESVFARYGISYFLNAPQPLSEHPFYSYITGAAEAALKGFAVSDTLVFLKSPYFEMHGVSDKEKNIFENYCLYRGIDRGGFFREFIYGGERERDPVERKRKEEEKNTAEAVRKKLAAALESFVKLKTGGDYAAAIEGLLVKSEGITERLISVSEYRAAEALRQGAAAFKAVAGEIARIFGDAPVTLRRFLDVFKRGCGLYTLSSIPETQDCVIIGGPEIARLCPPQVLFIMNACEGSLPLREDDCGIINDSDIGELEKEGIACIPSVSRANLRLSAEVFQAAVSPKVALHISYPSEGADGKPRGPAPLISSVCSLFIKDGAPLAPYSENLRFQQMGTEGFVARNKYPPSPFVPPPPCVPHGSETIQNAAKLFFYKDSTKVSQIESFYACPYAHFLEYGLRLKERPEAGPDGAGIGTLLHEVLERFMKGGMARGGGAVFDGVMESPEYAPLKNLENEPLLKRLRAESEKVCAVLKEQNKHSSFVPAYFELNFSERGDKPPLALDGKSGGLKISGKIDRADVAEKGGVRYARVIDYKTGARETKLTYTALGRGENLQPLVYLAYMRGLGYAPAGAFYFRVHNTGGDYCMNGVYGRERGLPALMDSRLEEPEFKSDIIKAVSTKAGDLRKHPYAVTEEELNRLCDYALSKAVDAGSRIEGGECAVSPVKDACRFCPYGGVCLFDPDRDEVRKGGKTYRTAEELLQCTM